MFYNKCKYDIGLAMHITNEKIVEKVKEICPESTDSIHRGQLTLKITSEKLVETAKFLKESSDISFDMLLDITAIDWYKKQNPRFEVVYFLYSNKNKSRLRLKVGINESELVCPSLVGVWESANWYERETWDMYGIKFEGHPTLRRFYMPEDFVDPVSGEKLHPLRKDFPLMGIPDSLPLPPYPEKEQGN
jgi:NADH-quinone oxidoreductase subunit C